MNIDHDDLDDIDDDKLDRRRRKLEAKALRVADEMLDDPKTSATARASIIRGVFSDSAARRNDDNRKNSPFDGMTSEEINHAIRVTEQAIRVAEREIAMFERKAITDAEFEEIAPAGGDVFG